MHRSESKSIFRALSKAMACAALFLLAAAGARADVCKAPQDLSESDRQAVFALVQRLGMVNPARACSGYFPSRSAGEPAIRVESEPMVAGTHLAWQTLWFVRCPTVTQGLCSVWLNGTPVGRAGDWVTGADALGVDEVWRIEFAGGRAPLDVHIDTGVWQGDAEKLVRALGDGTWVADPSAPQAGDRGWEQRWTDQVLQRDHVSVGRSRTETDVYVVMGIGDDGGQGVELRLVGDQVQWLRQRQRSVIY